MGEATKTIDEILQEDIKKDEFVKLLEVSEITASTQIPEPENVVTIKAPSYSGKIDQRLFTAGNFSAIIGQQKSKKTFLTGVIMAAASSYSCIQGCFTGHIQKKCFYFDTEQGEYDVMNTAKRILKTGGDENNLRFFSLRKYSPKQRQQIIGYALEEFKDEVGYVVIDGIADLVNSINDPDEATLITTKLLNWTAEYGIHITTVIHQNKSDNYATGWLGRSIEKKCEIVIEVKKNEHDFKISEVKTKDSRGPSFEAFEIYIDQFGLVQIEQAESYENVSSLQEDNDPF